MNADEARLAVLEERLEQMRHSLARIEEQSEQARTRNIQILVSLVVASILLVLNFIVEHV